MHRSILSPCIRFVLVILGLTLAAQGADDPDPRQASRGDLKRLQGTWTLVSLEREGAVVPADELERSEAVYQGDLVVLRARDRVRRRGIISLDASRKPRAINTWDIDGPFADRTVPGIYELEGDRLRLCFGEPGGERPTSFSTREGGGVLLATYQRARPKP
ncbi:MAG: TIGR03067 domain-containing protein [Isosphaeraceae bacterium]